MQRWLRNLCIQFIILHYLGYSMGKYTISVISYANGCYYHLWTEDHQSSIVCNLWVMRIICRLWVINHIGELWGFQRAERVCNRDIRPSSPNRHTTPFYISTYTPPPSTKHHALLPSNLLNKQAPGRTQTEDNGSPGGDRKRKQSSLPNEWR